MEWVIPNISNPHKIREIETAEEDPVETYRDRWLIKEQVGASDKYKRYYADIFSDFDSNSSLLLAGSGHSDHANFILRRCEEVTEVAALDYVEEARHGLDPAIRFYHQDIRSVGNIGPYDYVFSSHTVEHFTREEILNLVLPNCLNIARRAVIFVVPYGDSWGDEPSHRCHFYEDDELVAQALRYKKIHTDHELVLWFEGKANK